MLVKCTSTIGNTKLESRVSLWLKQRHLQKQNKPICTQPFEIQNATFTHINLYFASTLKNIYEAL